MDDLQFRREVLDNISESFCGAKWYNATIWLGSGQTTSCHHPPAHTIGAEFHTNPKAIHNTAQKKEDRRMMQAGERPPGCEYCWKIEDMGRDAVSDRIYKSKIYEIHDLRTAAATPADQDINLKTLEISFDRTCQFACSYCNPAFSSTWVKDIRNHGPYQGLLSDGRNHFTHTHDHSQLFRFGESNPYVDAFFSWWETDLYRTLEELRITGGEPLMSGYTWQLIDWFKQNPGRSQTRLAINSNLGMEWSTIQRLLTSCQDIVLDIYTSNEAMGAHAEYIRDGLDWQIWNHNVQNILMQEDSPVRAIHSMCTINALCLESLTEYLDHLLLLKKIYGRERVNFTLNILRFPSFQSPLILPREIRDRHRINLITWIEINRDNPSLHQHELNHVQRLIDYLDAVKTPHNDSFDLSRLCHDFRKFYQQYDLRRHKDFETTFPELASWYQTL